MVDESSKHPLRCIYTHMERLVDGVWHICVCFLSDVFTVVFIARPLACTRVLHALDFAFIERITKSCVYVWFAVVWLSCCLFYRRMMAVGHK